MTLAVHVRALLSTTASDADVLVDERVAGWRVLEQSGNHVTVLTAVVYVRIMC